MHLQHLLDAASTPFKPSCLPKESDYVSVLANSDGEYLVFIASPGVSGARALHTATPSVSFDVIGGRVPIFDTEPAEAAFIAACWDSSRSLRYRSKLDAGQDEPRVIANLNRVTRYSQCWRCRVRIACTSVGTWHHLDEDGNLRERSCSAAPDRVNGVPDLKLRRSWKATPQ